MAVFTSYEIKNDKEFARQIDKAIRLVGDLRIAFTIIAKDWRKSNKAQFQLKNAGQYPPLSSKYAARKVAGYGNKPILVRTGKLRDSVSGTLNSDSIQVIGKNSLIMGTRVPYGVYHQSDDPRRKIPLRKFLFIGPESPRTAPRAITGRLERWMSILNAETQRKLDKGF